MDFDMEMASVQIDHLCHLNNQLSAWQERSGRGACCRCLITRKHIKGRYWSRCNSASSVGFKNDVALCSPAVDLRSPLNLCCLGFAHFVAPDVSNCLDTQTS